MAFINFHDGSDDDGGDDDDVDATCKCKGCISAVDTEPSSVIVTRPSSADEEPLGPRHSKNT